MTRATVPPPKAICAPVNPRKEFESKAFCFRQFAARPYLRLVGATLY
jgi:hypothetical protein